MDTKITEKRVMSVRLEKDDIDDAVLDFVNNHVPDTNGMDILKWERPYDNVIDIEFNLNTYKDLGRENPYNDKSCDICDTDKTIDGASDELLIAELESRDFYVYDNPDDAVSDASYESLKNSIEDGHGAYVYENPEDALADVDDDVIKQGVENLGYFVYQAPADAIVDCDDDELIEEIHNRQDNDMLFKVLESMDTDYVLRYLMNNKGYKLKKVCATSRCGCC